MSDLNKAADEILIDLINETNEKFAYFTPFAYGGLTFRNVKPYDIDPAYNTTIEVTDVGSPGETDWRSVFYNRVPLSKVFNSKEAVLPYKAEYTNMHALVGDLSEHYGVLITTSDVVNDSIGYDSGTDILPYRIQISAAATSKIYIGYGYIDLVDPTTGTAILTEPSTSQGAIITGNMINGSDLVGLAGIDTSNFSISDNGEILVSSKIDVPGRTDATLTTVNNVNTWNIPLSFSDNWKLVYNVGLLSTANGTSVDELYNVYLNIPTHGETRINTKLVKVGSNYFFQNQDGMVSIPVTYVSGTADVMQWTVQLSDYPTATLYDSKNVAGAVLGDSMPSIYAKRKVGQVPLVGGSFRTHTVSEANAIVNMLSPEHSLHLIASPTNDYELHFTMQVQITGPAGVDTELANDVTIAVTMPVKGSFKVDPVSNGAGINLSSNGTGLIPQGLARGLYVLTGIINIDKSYSFATDGNSLEFTIGYTPPIGDAVTQTLTWPVHDVGDATEDPPGENESTGDGGGS